MDGHPRLRVVNRSAVVSVCAVPVAGPPRRRRRRRLAAQAHVLNDPNLFYARFLHTRYRTPSCVLACPAPNKKPSYSYATVRIRGAYQSSAARETKAHIQ